MTNPKRRLDQLAALERIGKELKSHALGATCTMVTYPKLAP